VTAFGTWAGDATGFMTFIAILAAATVGAILLVGIAMAFAC